MSTSAIARLRKSISGPCKMRGDVLPMSPNACYPSLRSVQFSKGVGGFNRYKKSLSGNASGNLATPFPKRYRVPPYSREGRVGKTFKEAGNALGNPIKSSQRAVDSPSAVGPTGFARGSFLPHSSEAQERGRVFFLGEGAGGFNSPNNPLPRTHQAIFALNCVVC